MKQITTIICCFAFMVSGIMLAIRSPGTDKYGSNTAIAATPMKKVVGTLPLDLQLDLEKRLKKDTVYLPGDTTYLPGDTVRVIKTKYVKVPNNKRTTDTLYKVMPIPGPIPNMAVNNNISGVREEQAQVGLQRTKQRSVTLAIDGKVVYKTENDIHSTGDIE